MPSGPDDGDKPVVDPSQAALFDLAELTVEVSEQPRVSAPDYPIHTAQKAQLIAEYLRLFVIITRHGTYIDGFAGPQSPDAPNTWAAKLVIEAQPREADRPRLRHFFLYEKAARKIPLLEGLREERADLDIVVRKGDFNEKISSLLSGEAITGTEATFCLLDQRTFECHWATVELLARHKAGPYKIELFYFLAQKWLDRALAAQKDVGELAAWWGSRNWEECRQRRGLDRALYVANRFRTELGYRYVTPWPILDRPRGGGIMYYMIHASDHPESVRLMDRAYRLVRGQAPPTSEGPEPEFW